MDKHKLNVVTCYNCDGDGWLQPENEAPHKCDVCDGEGFLPEEKAPSYIPTNIKRELLESVEDNKSLSKDTLRYIQTRPQLKERVIKFMTNYLAIDFYEIIAVYEVFGFYTLTTIDGAKYQVLPEFAEDVAEALRCNCYDLLSLYEKECPAFREA